MTTSEPKTGWIGVDLDGTLVEYHGWVDADNLGKPIMPMVNRIRAWIAEGEDVRIFTARVWFDPLNPETIESAETARQAIIDFCLEHFDTILPVTHEKDYHMKQLWDDRAVGVEPNTGMPQTNHNILEALKMIEECSGYDGAHHKSWVFDQVVRILLNDDFEAYDRWVAEYEDGSDGPHTYEWDRGIAP